MPPRHPPALTAAAVAGAVLLLASGCHPTGGSDQPPHAPAVHEQAGGTLPAQAAAATLGGTSDPPRAEAAEGVEDASADAGANAGAGGPAGPEQVAAGLVIDTLAAQGLHAVVLDTHLLATGPQRASVRVQVAHHPGSGHPTQADYDLELTRTPHGWQPTPTERSG
jgi:hypothetical protein